MSSKNRLKLRYLLAYRGKCRADLPTIPPERHVSLRHDIDIEMYNFAERMDEFGYNFSRVNQTGVYKFYLPDEDLIDTNYYG